MSREWRKQKKWDKEELVMMMENMSFSRTMDLFRSGT
jgi:hypothetical protein